MRLSLRRQVDPPIAHASDGRHAIERTQAKETYIAFALQSRQECPRVGDAQGLPAASRLLCDRRSTELLQRVLKPAAVTLPCDCWNYRIVKETSSDAAAPLPPLADHRPKPGARFVNYTPID